MSGHLLTWRLFLSKLTALGACDESQLQATAEALSVAAPNGPRGFACVDECQCQDAAPRLAGRVYVELVERLVRPMDRADSDLRSLREAVAIDVVSPDTRVFRPVALASVGVVVSSSTSNVAIARAEWPRTWSAIERMVEESPRRR